MDLAGEMRRLQEQRKTMFSLNHYDSVAAYVTQLLEKHASGEATTNATMNDIMIMFLAVDNGDAVALQNMISPPNWPSKTGNPSGGNRTNAPGRK
ncbi:hypothetical protein HVY71_25725 (plasmid) [Citrobacter freundii]|nr:hypothetical protein [Citrobacter freundii]MBA8335356.1 hypothetical protein [Citrobacter freundii]MBA8564089.1 hypothetical protein [Citrobacter freundii]QLM88869.1 hypothetical protein HVX13_24215 [Citrobacter freundii]QMF90293.1 hypothetical protein HVY72_23815 [Citrobacter freundii]